MWHTPTNLDDAVKNAIRVERAMGLDDRQRVQAVQTGGREDLHEVLDKLVEDGGAGTHKGMAK